MTNDPFHSAIDPELCVGQEVHSANEIIFVLNRLAESTGQSPESPIQTQKREDRKGKVHNLIGAMVSKVKELFLNYYQNKPLETVADNTTDALQKILTEAETSPKQVTGNYGVAALIIDKKTRKIVAAGKNSVSRDVYHGGELNAQGDDGHAEVNALRAFYKKKAKALDAAKSKGNGSLDKVQQQFDEKNYELWVNLEPCHMCAGAIRSCGMPAVYVATDPVAVTPYAELYKEAPEPATQIADLIHQVEDPQRQALFGERDTVDPTLCEESDRVFTNTDKEVRAKKTLLTQQKHEILDIMTVRDHGTDAEKETAKKIIAAIHSVSNEANETGRNIFTVLSDKGHVESELVRDPKDNKIQSDSISRKLAAYIEEAAESAEKNGNKQNAAVAIDPFGVPWFCTNDRTDTRSPLRTPIMRLLRRIEKARTEAGPEIASHMPLPGEFTIVSYKEPNDMEAGRFSRSSVKNALYLNDDDKCGAVTTGLIAKMTPLNRIQRGLEAAVRPVQSIDIGTESTKWQDRDFGKARTIGELA